MSENSFLTPSLIKAAYKSKKIFLFAGPEGQVMASPSITSIINEHDLSLWDQLSKDDYDVQESAVKAISELLQSQNLACKISRVGSKLYLTSFKKND